MHVREVLAILSKAAAEGVDAYGLACRVADAAVEHHAAIAEAAGADLVAAAIRARLPAEAPKPRHSCGVCGVGVMSTAAGFIRGCEHVDAAIVADISAEARGHGGVVDP